MAHFASLTNQATLGKMYMYSWQACKDDALSAKEAFFDAQKHDSKYWVDDRKCSIWLFRFVAIAQTFSSQWSGFGVWYFKTGMVLIRVASVASWKQKHWYTRKTYTSPFVNKQYTLDVIVKESLRK